MDPIPTNSTSPKYALAENAILAQIEAGAYAEGEKIPSVRNLSNELQIAPNTVQQALGRLVDQGILERRARIGTFVRRAQATGNVALLIFHVPDVHNTSIPRRAIEAVQNELRASHRHVRPIHLVEPYPTAAQLYAELRAMKVGAAGYLGFLNTDRPLIQSLAELLPGLLLLKELPGVSLPCVLTDAAESARLVVDHFVERGRRHIGLCAVNTEHDFHMELSHALQAELSRRGLPVNKAFFQEVVGVPEPGDLVRLGVDLMSKTPRPDGLLCFTGDVAHALNAQPAQRCGRLGRDYDVVMLYSGTTAQHHPQPGALLMLNYTEALARGARLLSALAEGDSVDGTPVLRSRPRLVVPPLSCERDDSRKEAPGT